VDDDEPAGELTAGVHGGPGRGLEVDVPAAPPAL